MIAFRQRTLWESFRRAISPSVRRREDAELKEAIRQLVTAPSMPCMVDGNYCRGPYDESILNIVFGLTSK